MVLRKCGVVGGDVVGLWVGVGWMVWVLLLVVHPLFHPLPGLICFLSCERLLVHPSFHPLPGLTHFLCLAKESKQRKARPRWRPPP